MEPGVLLVHGAWHGAWCWDSVLALLPNATAIDLPSNHGGGGFDGDVAAVRSALDSMDAPVVLVGHSYGGAVVSAAGDHPNVGNLVFLCAYALDEGESLAANGAPAADGASLTPGMDGEMLVVDAEVAREAFYGDCSEQPVDRLVPHPLEAFLTPVGSPAWRVKPSTYVVCTEDQAIHPEQQRFFAARCSHVVELPASHSPMLSMPDRVAEVVRAAAT